MEPYTKLIIKAWLYFLISIVTMMAFEVAMIEIMSRFGFNDLFIGLILILAVILFAVMSYDGIYSKLDEFKRKEGIRR